MARSKKDGVAKRSQPPARTLEGREKQMISKAVDLAEKQLEDGSASAQVITHYLKLGTTTERLAQERLRSENELLKAKTESLKSQKKIEEMYADALNAIRSYNGQPPLPKGDEDELDD